MKTSIIALIPSAVYLATVYPPMVLPRRDPIPEGLRGAETVRPPGPNESFSVIAAEQQHPYFSLRGPVVGYSQHPAVYPHQFPQHRPAASHQYLQQQQEGNNRVPDDLIVTDPKSYQSIPLKTYLEQAKARGNILWFSPDRDNEQSEPSDHTQEHYQHREHYEEHKDDEPRKNDEEKSTAYQKFTHSQSSFPNYQLVAVINRPHPPSEDPRVLVVGDPEGKLRDAFKLEKDETAVYVVDNHARVLGGHKGNYTPRMVRRLVNQYRQQENNDDESAQRQRPTPGYREPERNEQDFRQRTQSREGLEVHQRQGPDIGGDRKDLNYRKVVIERYGRKPKIWKKGDEVLVMDEVPDTYQRATPPEGS